MNKVEFLFMLLPFLVNGRIKIRIAASRITAFSSEEDVDVEISGLDTSVITDKDKRSFQITDYMLKSAIQQTFGKWPENVYLKDPTMWGNKYSEFGWTQVKRQLYPKYYTILGVHTESVIITSQEFTNNSTSEIKCNAGISQQVENTVSHSWSTNGEFSLNQAIEYGIEFANIGVKGTTSISYTSGWGEEKTKSKTVTLGSSSGVEVTLKPGQAVISTLSATRGSMEVEIEYAATVEGHVLCSYEPRYKGHYFWNHYIDDLLSAKNLPSEITSSEILKIGFYSDVKILVEDVTYRRR